MKTVLFIHHSTGANIIREGRLRNLLYSKTTDLEFWDHGYNLNKNIPNFILKIIANKLTYRSGLSDKGGNILGLDFNINISNNNPKDYLDLFSKDPKSDKTLKSILNFDIIAFKNCYPTTRIENDSKLDQFKKYYQQMGDIFLNYDNKFIAFTPPPLRKELTNTEFANRASKFSEWLNNEWKKPNNTYVFDLFGILADKNGFLKREYCRYNPFDSHPNKKANKVIAGMFVEFLVGL